MARMVLKHAYVEIVDLIDEAGRPRLVEVRVKPTNGPTSARNPVFVMKQRYRWWNRWRARRQLRRFDR